MTCTSVTDSPSDYPAKSSTTFRGTTQKRAAADTLTGPDLRLYYIVQSKTTAKR
jgi:hypothetical protein